MKKTLAVTAFAFCLLSCSHAPVKNAEPWDQYVNGYLDRFFSANPADAVSAGRHEFDGQLPDWSPQGLLKESARLHAERVRAASYPDGALDERQRFERDYVLAATDARLFWLEESGAPAANPQFYSWQLDPNVYVTREYAPPEQRLRAFVKYARAVPTACAQIRQNLRPPFALPLLKQGKLVFGGLASYIAKDVPGVFAHVGDDALQAEFHNASIDAAKALNDLVAWLGTQEPTATAGFALGTEKFQKMLWATERVDTPVDQIEKIGWADLDHNTELLRDACHRFARKSSLEQCLKKMASRKPVRGMVATAKNQLKKLRAFVESSNIISIPGTEQADVRESPPYMRWNAAYIDIPGPYEKGLPSIYYVAPPDPSWSKKEQEEYIPGRAVLQDISAHEVWPGHFLQFLHANRSSSKFGQVFAGYAYAEGWASYVEELVLDVGLDANSPESRIGQLQQALLRDVRLLSAIGLHTGKMTQEGSEKLFRERAFADPGSARQQAARGTFDPAYLNYTLGKLMIRKLRDDWCHDRGDRDAWKQFHDKFLSYGGPPIPLVRQSMMGVAGASPVL